jgi:TRAP-type mannitol/chloroaromatic compound transport system permease small subunit
LRTDQSESLLDRISSITGKAAAWLTLFMVIVTFVVVIMRYVFDAGLIWVQESVVWMHAVVFMLGAAYTLRAEEHVRVDIFYRTMSERRRAWVDLIGVIVFLLPLCAFLAWARCSSRYCYSCRWPFPCRACRCSLAPSTP